MSGFVPGLQLCHNFYDEVVAPAVGVSHGAALLGPGSDVLGYDTERSTDHEWALGPCQLVHGARAVAGQALRFAPIAGDAQPAIVNGTPRTYRRS